MRIIIEYCRARSRDSALAVIDRVYCDAVNVAAARGIAVVLAASRAMPQSPDLVRVLDENGTEFFREAICPAVETSLPASPVWYAGNPEA